MDTQQVCHFFSKHPSLLLPTFPARDISVTWMDEVLSAVQQGNEVEKDLAQCAELSTGEKGLVQLLVPSQLCLYIAGEWNQNS